VLEARQSECSTQLLRLRLSADERAAGDHCADPAPAQLLARITRRSADLLALQPGDALFARVKGVALM
jgi:molybdate transport system ATP-binding protein